jgi:hypothetical protein
LVTGPININIQKKCKINQFWNQYIRLLLGYACNRSIFQNSSWNQTNHVGIFLCVILIHSITRKFLDWSSLICYVLPRIFAKDILQLNGNLLVRYQGIVQFIILIIHDNPSAFVPEIFIPAYKQHLKWASAMFLPKFTFSPTEQY